MVSMSPLLAAKQLTWVPEESAVHEQFCEGLVQNGTVELQVIPQFLSSSRATTMIVERDVGRGQLCVEMHS